MATETSSTGRDSDKFMLRFPDGMRDRIAEAAKAANRSMNAEIVARLEQSFESKSDDGRQFMELLVSNMMSRSETLGLRFEVVKMRLQSEKDKFAALSREIDLDSKESKSDEDFARMEKKIQELTAVRDTVSEIQAELAAIRQERSDLNKQMESAAQTLTGTRQSLESRMAEYLERKAQQAKKAD